jgi:hypothetical protein
MIANLPQEWIKHKPGIGNLSLALDCLITGSLNYSGNALRINGGAKINY